MSLLDHEEQRVRALELLAEQQKQQQGETDLAYRDMNSRFLNAESTALKKENRDEELTQRQQEHEKRKKEIERAWHQNTAGEVAELRKKAEKVSEKDAAYYQNFTLRELESFIKNSDRGGNSKEYNDVATDLEVFNRIAADKNADPNEQLPLLRRIQESCNTYLTTRKKTIWRTGTGKIRRAIIEQISLKVQESITMQETSFRENLKASMEAYQNEKTDKTVTNAFKAHFDMVNQVMNGSIQLDADQMKQLDQDMTAVMADVKKMKTDENQSRTFSTQFFNALGYSSNDPQIVDMMEFEDAVKKSPVKKKMFHSMNPFGKMKDAALLADQLAGTAQKGNRVYYGIGRAGKGIYTAAKTDKSKFGDGPAKIDSWRYGGNVGGAMMTMTLNGYARIIEDTDMKDLKEELKKKFPKAYDFITRADPSSGCGYQDYLTMLAALCGYNTVKTYGPANVDYYTTSDRKAFTICEDIEVRNEEFDDKKNIDHDYQYVDTHKLQKKNGQ